MERWNDGVYVGTRLSDNAGMGDDGHSEATRVRIAEHYRIPHGNQPYPIARPAPMLLGIIAQLGSDRFAKACARV
jgi:hypothetical protein